MRFPDRGEEPGGISRIIRACAGCLSASWVAPLALIGLLLPPSTAPGGEPLPIFDAHLHYSSPAWSEVPPALVESKLAEAGVLRALVSSTPDDGTLMLHRANGSLYVPILRPYRADVSSGNWFTDAATPDYIAGRLANGVYQGIGEFHLLDAAQARAPVPGELARMAAEREILLHVHSGAEAVAALFEIEPRSKILWAHAGMVTPPQDIRRMMDTHPKLWAELSFRAGGILGEGSLDPAWKALLLAHSDRFLVGSDTYVTSRWGEYGYLIAQHRRWLALLPPQTAKAIAYRNAVRLFGSGGIATLER